MKPIPPRPIRDPGPGPARGTLAAAVVLGLLLLLLSSGEARGQRAERSTISPPTGFDSAVTAGTRSADGRPGAGYWQQEADYRISAALHPETGRVDGQQTITYTNHSPDTLREIVVHLDQNVFAEGARRNRRAPITGGMRIQQVHVNGRAAPTRHPGSGYYQSLTLLEVQLPEPLAPGGTTEVMFRWNFTVPPAPTFRTGNLGGDVFAVAQWYPRVAVYDDVFGWDRTPYLGDGEFYLEYGNFEVELTVPAGWLVAATGELRNPDEVLRPASLSRLDDAFTSDTTISIVTAEEAREGTTTRIDRGRELTWRFTATNVRDFAFATSPDYQWDAAGVAVPGSGDRALVQAFYRPDLQAWGEGVSFVRHGIETFSRWLGPYVYPQLTIAETPVGGMEYPMLVFNPSTNSPRSLASVTLHEAAHQWVPMTVGTMEAKHAWMDEGIVSYWDELSLAELYGEPPPRWGTTSYYLQLAGSESEVPLMTHTDLVSPYGARQLAAYVKPAVALGALRAVMGDEAFVAAFQDFHESWRFKHPQPWDFFNTFERHHGTELDWFWKPLFFETATLDHAVTSVEATDERSIVTIEDRGDVVLPTPVTLVYADGTRTEERIPYESWLVGERLQVIAVDGEVVEVHLDPEGLFPDVDRSNNVWNAGSRP